ncbi:hypothetical protein NECAME_10267 [Necator americanus]|uniref:Reverse transcriptase domain-containing protein n=1 Tax=Necator americanus TaxID=51031 RepID=W2T974_NECAM|nr:hypothetical protein NECAME_10267 [Necator americanus]ETN78570.1 hypothetical protein NECAME_10267 [Necator americanus]
MKVFECVLEARLRKIVSVSLNQCGFVKDCSTIDAIHAVRILLEKHREKSCSVYLAFLDLEKAFDRVPHELLWMSMRSHRVPEEYVRWTKLLYAKSTSVVRCAAGTSRPFPVQVGVHQGSSLSPLLFILCMDTITKEIRGLYSLPMMSCSRRSLEVIFRNKYSLGRIGCRNMDCASTHQKLSTWSADQG